MSNVKTIKPYGHGEYFAALDGFRGLLAVFVAIYHTIWLTHVNQWAFFNNGPVIIDLFFAFSGFLMFRLYNGFLKDGPSAKSFMKRRFARLYPIHIFMTLLFLAFAAFRLWAHKIGWATHEAGEILPFAAGASEGWRSLFSHLTLTHAMGVNDSLTYNPPSWTISAEFYTYFVFVAMMLWARPKKLLHFSLIALGIAAIYAALSRVKPDMNITYDLGFWRCMAGFFTGILAANTYVALKPKVEQWAADGKSNIMTMIEAAVLILSMLFVIYCGGKMQFLVAPVLFLFVVVFAFDGGAVSKFMSARVFRYLAKISYSVYMTHVIISIVIAILAERVIGGAVPDWNPTGWGGDAVLLVYLAAVICFSHLTYHFVEVPGARFLRNFSLKRTAKKAAEPA